MPGHDYTITAEKPGYQTEMVDVDAADLPADDIDFALCEEPYPVSFVFADPNQEDTECMVTWSLPMGPYLIAYDDGTAEDYFAWANPGNAVCVKFTPAGYPATVGRRTGIYVGDGSFPVGGDFLGTNFAVGILDDDRSRWHAQGTVVDSVVVTSK